MRRFNAMVEKCRHQVYTLAFYSLGSRDEAEDVTQEVLVRLWEHWKEIERATAMAWIIRVTRNVCLDIHRKRQTRNSLMAVHGEACLVPEPSSRTNPELAYERKDFRARVERALCDIDEPYRTIVVLREIEEYSYAEICDAMEMPLNTVKVYLHRGRRILRERMRHEVGVVARATRELQALNTAGNNPQCHSETASADEESAFSNRRAPGERKQIPRLVRLRSPQVARNDRGGRNDKGVKSGTQREVVYSHGIDPAAAH